MLPPPITPNHPLTPSDTPILQASSSSQQINFMQTSNEGIVEDLSFLNPYRQKVKKYVLIHRGDTKNCPKGVTRCEYCRVNFDSSDMVIVKTSGKRESTCSKTGKDRIKVGNVYLHNLIGCLTDYDKNFSYKDVLVLKPTFERLSANARELVYTLKMKLEE